MEYEIKLTVQLNEGKTFHDLHREVMKLKLKNAVVVTAVMVDPPSEELLSDEK